MIEAALHLVCRREARGNCNMHNRTAKQTTRGEWTQEGVTRHVHVGGGGEAKSDKASL